ncbi:MAG TPA: ribokinase [Acetobacteraceae bacterium]|nr:ribokinase [Acetobacteraceae bacterium]
MIVVFGSINLDLIFRLPAIPCAGQTLLAPGIRIEPGGKGANQAVAAARDGAQVVMAGAVGRDALAAGALDLLRRAQIDLSRVVETDAATGCAAIFVDPQGANAIGIGSGANLAARATQIEDALLGPTTTLVLQMEVPAAATLALIHRARARGARIILNLAPALPIDTAALSALDLLVVNETEAGWLGDHLGCSTDAAALRATLGVDVVRTLGEDGADVATASVVQRVPAHRITPVDTTAAGDCFVGVLAAALDRGASLADALTRASVAAAVCCTRAGSQSSLPTTIEIDALSGARPH